MKLACVDCHATAAKSARLEDNNLPRREACLKCHSDAVIKNPARTLLSRFDHAKHLKLGNLAPVIAKAIDTKAYLSSAGNIRKYLNTQNACAACHRGLEESGAVSQANFPQMADCLVCHSTVDPPFSCEFCHSKDTKLKPGNHSPDFIDTHTRAKSGLDKTTCAVCHGRRFTCLGCH